MKSDQDGQANKNRREFLSMGVAATLVAVTGVPSNAHLAVGAGTTDAYSSQAEQFTPSKPGTSYFNFDKSYTSDETEQLLLVSRRKHLTGTSQARVGLPFWWDKDAKMLVNPFNVKYDASVAAGEYEFATTLQNFRASQAELGDVWNKLTNNAQVSITAGGISPENDPLKWIIMTGINIADNVFSTKDKQLVPLTQNNTPTDDLRPSERVTFKNGFCTLQMQVSAQKKKSFWDTLLQIIKPIVNSPVFGILPIPKLYIDTAKTITAAFDQFESQSRLVNILGGKSYEFRIYDGTPEADLKFRPGHWVILDSEFAGQHMDANSNLSGVYLDIPGLLYQLKDSNNQPIDTTYSVTQVRLNKVVPHS